MKQMVNAFSEYARAPDMHFSRFDLNQLITEVVDLYRVQDSSAEMKLLLSPQLPAISADRMRIRQILNNLVTNSLEALEGKVGARIEIETQFARRGSKTWGVRRDRGDRQRSRLSAGFDRYRLRSLCHQQAEGHGVGSGNCQENRRRTRRAH